MSAPLSIGTHVPGLGRITAVGYLGERYYWLGADNGSLSMLPAQIVESMLRTGETDWRKAVEPPHGASECS